MQPKPTFEEFCTLARGMSLASTAPDGPDRECVPLILGGVGPISTERGVKVRLQNLGLFPHSLDDASEGAFESALRAFQESADLEATGRVDDATRAALAERYGG